MQDIASLLRDLALNSDNFKLSHLMNWCKILRSLHLFCFKNGKKNQKWTTNVLYYWWLKIILGPPQPIKNQL